jgi:hypothetical protein
MLLIAGLKHIQSREHSKLARQRNMYSHMPFIFCSKQPFIMPIPNRPGPTLQCPDVLPFLRQAVNKWCHSPIR